VILLDLTARVFTEDEMPHCDRENVHDVTTMVIFPGGLKNVYSVLKCF